MEPCGIRIAIASAFILDTIPIPTLSTTQRWDQEKMLSLLKLGALNRRSDWLFVHGLFANVTELI